MRKSAIVILVAALPLFAQHQERITVDLVQVPVYVSHRGVPVTGLTKDDFELYVNGDRQQIDYFDVVDRREARAQTQAAQATAPSIVEQPPADLEQRRLYLLLFDIHSQPHRLLQAKTAARQAVQEAPAGDVFAVATLSAVGIRFVVPFSNDRVALERAIATLVPSRAGDALQIATLETERSVWGQHLRDELGTAVPNNGSWDSPGVRSVASGDAAAQMLEHELFEQSERTYETFDRLGELADRLAPLTGSKHVVLFSEGFGGAGASASTYQVLNRMHRKFLQAGVILDAVHIGTPIAPWPSADMRMGAAPSMFQIDRSSSLYPLALQTGGTVVKHSSIDASIRELRDMQSVAYVLSFRPSANSRARNSIKVRVKDQRFGTVVQYRRGYAATGDDANNGLLLADILTNDIPQRGLTVTVTAAPDGMVTTSIPGSELLARIGDGNVTLEVFLYLFDENNVVADWGYQRMVLDLDKGRDFLATNSYDLMKKFKLGPGKYTAKALVRIVGTEAVGFERAAFQIAAR